MPPPVYLALIHYPVYNSQHEIVTTSITPFDLHDIARTCKTFGIAKYFVVCPVESQRVLAQRILDHWLTGVGGQLNQTRKDAFETLCLSPSLEDVRLTIEKQTANSPRLVATSAKAGDRRISYAQFREDLSQSTQPHLLMFGTGWGMTEELLAQAETILDPIAGAGDGSYNHLPVRAAVAIILDRIFS